VDVWVVFVLFARGIVRYVSELIVEVLGVSYAVFVIAAMPDFSGGLLAYRKGIAAFNELNAS